ncbi:hypothetical protein FE394_18015 [Xenorhabdus sp. Reich]|uniref:Transposase n=1 Tax=Xenorhabdus littoralis TaxID=2582835 RepID=A0ABU4SQT9_9GAMM|nr:hypothetical protein [Xenorhabdus sp. Reich]
MITYQTPIIATEYRAQANQSSFSPSLFRMYCLALQLETIIGKIEERANIMRTNNTLPPQSK